MQDRFAKKISDQPSPQKLYLKFSSFTNPPAKEYPILSENWHLEKQNSMRSCLWKPNLSELHSNTLPFR